MDMAQMDEPKPEDKAVCSLVNLENTHYMTLCYKPEGRGFDSRKCHWNFLLKLWPWG